jgi:hypothetical protein
MVTNSQGGAGRGGVAGLLAVCAVVAIPAIGRAQPATPSERRRIADPVPAAMSSSPVAARGGPMRPPFVEVAQDPTITRAWMRDFVTKLHMHMLNTDRTQTEADALTAYLLSPRRTR